MVRAYDTNEVSTIVDWAASVDGADDVHDRLLTLKDRNIDTNDDGTFKIYLIPGTYDIMIDKVAHLDEIYVARELNEGDEIDLGLIELHGGDLNKDGQIQLLDLALLSDVYDSIFGDESYVKEYDINEDEQLQLMDMAYISANYDMIRNINM